MKEINFNSYFLLNCVIIYIGEKNMYQSKYIKYKSIFKSGNDKETVELSGQGILELGEKIHISFQSNGSLIDIYYSDKEVILKNNQSKLRLVKDRMVLNEYQLPYGTTLLKTKLIDCKYKENHMSLKYELYDSTSFISTVYIVVNMI